MRCDGWLHKFISHVDAYTALRETLTGHTLTASNWTSVVDVHFERFEFVYDRRKSLMRKELGYIFAATA